MNDSLAGRRVVVVGASAGIGRAIAVRTVRSGARVALVARRQARLAEVVAEAGGGVPVPGDVRDLPSCTAAIGRSGEVLQGIDVLCYCAGMAPLALLADTESAHWQAVFETNVIGANHAIRAALPYMESTSVVMALSSDTAVQPRTGLGAYGASKSALRTAMASWRAECPGHRFCCVVVGPTAPTEFGDDFDGSLLGPLLEDWTAPGAGPGTDAPYRRRGRGARGDDDHAAPSSAGRHGRIRVAVTLRRGGHGHVHHGELHQPCHGGSMSVRGHAVAQSPQS